MSDSDDTGEEFSKLGCRLHLGEHPHTDKKGFWLISQALAVPLLVTDSSNDPQGASPPSHRGKRGERY